MPQKKKDEVIVQVVPEQEEPAPVALASEEPAPVAPASEEPAPAAPASEEPAPVAPASEEPEPAAPASEEPAPVAPASEEPKPLELEPGQVIYSVTGNITSLAHAGQRYPVLHGKVILPATDRWYDDLIQAGILKS